MSKSLFAYGIQAMLIAGSFSSFADLRGTSLVPFMMADSGKSADVISSWSDAPLCFDGVKFSKTGTDCWRSQIADAPSVTFSIPNEYHELLCLGYRVHRLSTGWYSRDRSPTAWKIEVRRDGENWQTVDTRSEVVWGGTQTDPNGGSDPAEADCSKEFSLVAGVPFRHIRFTPTESVRHVTEPGANDVGMMEIEYFVQRVASGLDVDLGLGGLKPRDITGFSPTSGTILETAAVVTAPPTAETADGRFRCVGYELTEKSFVGEVVSCVTNAERTYSFEPDGKPYALTWLWERTAWELKSYVREKGDAPTVDMDGRDTEYAAATPPSNCFDGICYTNDASFRWGAKLNASATVRTETPTLAVGYRLWQHSAGYNCNERAPTAWRLEGSKDGTKWETIDEKSGVVWYSQEHIDEYGIGQGARPPDEEHCSMAFEITAEAVYRCYRFIPTASWPTMEGTDWPVGLMEVEIFVIEVEPFTIEGSPQVPGVSPAYGGYLSSDYESGDLVCTAPDGVVFFDDCVWTNQGYAIEARDAVSGEWSATTNLGVHSYASTAADLGKRLVWLWAPVACLVDVSVDEGRETVTWSSQPDYVDADSRRYYRVGTTVEVSVSSGVSEPTVTAFKEFTGDTAGAQVKGTTIRIPVDGPRKVTAQYARHWKYYLDTEDAGNQGRITDGNWVFQVRGCSDAIGDYAAFKTLCFTALTFSKDPVGRIRSYVSGRGRLDLTTLNADMAEQAKTFEGTGPRPFCYLYEGTFRGEDAITEVVVPSDFIGYGQALFAECRNLTRARFAARETACTIQVGSATYDKDPGYDEVPGIFQNCPALTSVTLEGVRTIWPQMFMRDAALRNVKVPSSCSRICKAAFDSAKIDVLDLSKTTVSVIPWNCFFSCAYRRIVLPATVTTLSLYSFGCDKASFRPELREIDFMGPPPPTRSAHWITPANNPSYVDPSWHIVFGVADASKDSWTTNAKFLPYGTFKSVDRPHRSEMLALGPRFLGAWKGDNLAVLPDECYWIKKIPDTRGLVIFFR